MRSLINTRKDQIHITIFFVVAIVAFTILFLLLLYAIYITFDLFEMMKNGILAPSYK